MKTGSAFWFLPLIFSLVIGSGCKSDPLDDCPSCGQPTGTEIEFEARVWDREKRAGIFYEIFVRSFADSDGDGIGDLRGITDKLDYLDELGIAGIWLTPIHPSPSYHGYDVEDYTKVNPEFGTMADFETLVATAHSKGIKVVMDFVINHTSKTHPWFVSACTSTDDPYRDYYLFAPDGEVSDYISDGKVPMTNWYNSGEWHRVGNGTTDYRYMGVFSSWMPEINYGPVESAGNSPTFAAICDAARFWLDKGVDGFRLDAVKHIYQDEDSDENPRFLQMFYESLASAVPDLYMVGEVLSEHDKAAPYYYGLPALFDFSSWWRLEYAVNNQHAKWFPKDILDYRTEYAAVRPDFIQATKLSNHDEDRTRTALGGSLAKAKLAGTVLLTSAGNPYIYYGEELGMLGSKSSGDENVREPFLWENISSDKYRTRWHTPAFSTDDTVGNLASQRQDESSIFRMYEEFIALRNTYPALAYGTMSLPEDFDDSEANKNFMVFYQTYGNEKLLVVHNVSDGEKTYDIPADTIKPVAENGGVVVTSISGKFTARMPAWSSMIIEL